MNFRFSQAFQGAPQLLKKVPQGMRGRFDTVKAAYNRADKRTKRLYWLAAFAAILVAVWILIPAAGARRMPPPPVIVAKATSGNMNVVQKALGTVIANASVSITARVQGQLLSSGITEGQDVKKGDLLFVIDPRPYQAAYQQARAMLARDQAQAQAASRDRVRFAQLLKQQAVSKQQHDAIIANASALSATVAADRAAVETASLNLGYTTIRSPIDGKTGTILVQPGNLVRANDSQPLVVINQLKPVKVSFSLAQTEIPRLQARMRDGGLETVLYAHGTSTELARAPVTFIGNAVEALTGTIELRATFPNTDSSLVPGELVDVAVQLDRLKNVVIVPREAVNFNQDSRYIYVVNAEDKAEMRLVDVLHDDGVNMAVQGPIKAGDTVVTDGQLRVLPNMPVAVMKPKGEGGAGTKPPPS